ncbi:MAG: hypothetical protein SH868_07145 [Bythopirellula sp.]|nr:hypothetical protein [Bythopirellula sp.]
MPYELDEEDPNHEERERSPIRGVCSGQDVALAKILVTVVTSVHLLPAVFDYSARSQSPLDFPRTSSRSAGFLQTFVNVPLRALLCVSLR